MSEANLFLDLYEVSGGKELILTFFSLPNPLSLSHSHNAWENFQRFGSEQALRYGLVSTLRTVKLGFGVVSNVFTSISNILIKAHAMCKKNYVYGGCTPGARSNACA